MKLYLTPTTQIFSKRTRSIKDEDGNKRYTVKGKGKRLGVYDSNDEEVAVVWHSLLSHCTVEIEGNTVCEVYEKNKLSRQGYILTGIPWHLENEIKILKFKREFSLTDGSNPVMKFTIGFGGYELYIADPNNELLCLCVALAIDYATESERE